MTNIEFAHTLRGLADLYEKHEDLVQFGNGDRIYTYVATKEELTTAIRVLGSGEKSELNECLNYQPTKWPLSLWASKSNMGCTVIEETIEVPEKIIPAQEQRIIPAHQEKRIRYECVPFLAPAPKVRAVVEEPKLLAPTSGANFGGPGE